MNSAYKYTMILAVMLASGCALHPGVKEAIKTGDEVQVSLTCRLSNGDVVVTTDKSTAENASVKKSRIFFPLKEYRPLPMKAGIIPEGDPVRWGFMDELNACVARTAPGMRVGETKAIVCNPELVPGRAGQERFLRMARFRNRAKELRVPRAEYSARVGEEPVKGKPFKGDPDFPGRIIEVTDKEVVISFSLPESQKAQTPFGTGTVRDVGNHFEIALPVREGDLARTGAHAGRISAVEENMFTIDYGYSFAGEALRCSVETMRHEVRK